MKKVIAVLFLVTMGAISLLSHSGGTDAYGCHNETKTGGYHCH